MANERLKYEATLSMEAENLTQNKTRATMMQKPDTIDAQEQSIIHQLQNG